MAQTILRPVTPLGIASLLLEQLQSEVAERGLSDSIGTQLRVIGDLISPLEDYVERCSTPLEGDLSRLHQSTRRGDWESGRSEAGGPHELESEMLSGAAEARLLQLLIRCSGATAALDIGMFTGFSSLAMAEALPEGGRVVACEADPGVAAFAKERFAGSVHGDRIDVRIGPAEETLRESAASGEQFDFVFLDADKPGYLSYFNRLLDEDLLRVGGLLVVDNTLLQGEPYASGGPSTDFGQAIRHFNEEVAKDDRVEQVLLPLRDGVTLVRRRAEPC